MIKKKGIYIERIGFPNPYKIVYYDGKYLLIVHVNGEIGPILYEKYSGTTFIDKLTYKRTTITEVINYMCPTGINYVCERVSQFPLFNIDGILERTLERCKKNDN